ncbi:uncharacterized protein LOC143041789 [Oratosquilla oratoria]|uniref:uncharacterized protein LOC143041789 n=1 Tax=Oratosquilla oratoria TaxID=337810 RepID=UPI003F7706EE
MASKKKVSDRNKDLILAEYLLEEAIKAEQEAQLTKRLYTWAENEEIRKLKLLDFVDKNPTFIQNIQHILDTCTNARTGWTKFAEDCGVPAKDIEWSRLYHRSDLLEGPTAQIFRFIKRDNPSLTLGEVFDILKDLGRHDLLQKEEWQQGSEKIIEDETKAPKVVSVNIRTNTISPVPGLIIDKLKDMGVGESRTQELHIVQSSDGVANLASNEGQLDFVEEEKQKEEQIKEKKIEKEKEKEEIVSGAIVLILCADDAKEEARKVAEQLRKPISARPVIGALILQDSLHLLANGSNNTLMGWFEMVDYIVPILSPQFLKQTQNQDPYDVLRHNRVLYDTMLNEYIKNGSLNYRCRPLCPEKYYKKVQDHPVIRHNGLFQYMWCIKPNTIEEFANLLIQLKNYERRIHTSHPGTDK